MKPITKLKSLFVKETPVQTYDRENLRPVMLIRTDADLREFCRSYGIRPDEITTEY